MKTIVEQDHYEALDLSRGAAEEEVERAYRLALATYSEDSLAGYPVFEAGDVEMLRQRIEAAYRTLSDPESRALYDAHLEGGLAEPLPEAADAFAPPEPRAPEHREESLEALELVDDGEGEWSGPRLRRSRLSQGVEIQEIAEITKVNPAYLESIEEDRFDRLPAAVYVRGFVMGFASCLGLDAVRVARSYIERLEEHRRGGARRLFSRG